MNVLSHDRTSVENGNLLNTKFNKKNVCIVGQHCQRLVSHQWAREQNSSERLCKMG